MPKCTPPVPPTNLKSSKSKQMASPVDTIAAVATPVGEGGIGVVRISGTDAVAIAQRFFHPMKRVLLSEVPSHTCHFGRIASVDQCVVSVFRSPHSYTGEDVVEISSHGSPLILRKILEQCFAGGARLAAPGEFTQRAFLNGKLDLTQAEAVADLIRSKTDVAHTAALHQLEGRLSWAVRGLRDSLLPVLAHLEVGLDHSDEAHDFLPIERLRAKCAEMREAIDDILSSARVGKVLRQGFRLAIVGRPNAGKSSLLNALLKEERAIVTPIAGTTRDTLEETVSWDGIPVVLVDTAGLRQHTNDPIEKLGMDRTRQAIQSADLVLWVLDASELDTESDAPLKALLADKPVRRILNKMDLPSAATVSVDAGDLRLSAKTGEGLSAVIEAVKSEALGRGAQAGEAQWLLNTRHADALQRARAAVDRAEAAAGAEAYEECVALEIKTALDALGEIIGETTTEDLLGEIFANFCVGK